MLFEQIKPRSRGRLGGEISFDLGWFRGKFNSQSVESSRYEKIEIIEDYLSEQIGTIDEPKQYFRGTLDMFWGPYQDYEEMVYFSGATENTAIGLGGTITNCIPNAGAKQTTTTSYSLSSRLVTAMVRKGKLHLPRYGLGRDYKTDDINTQALEAVTEATIRRDVPRQTLTFLAKTVLFGQSQRLRGQAVLGTPLYVALAEEA